MKVINLSKRTFEQLEPLDLGAEIFNTEAKMYRFNYCSQRKIMKRLFHQEGVIFGSKLYTVEMLDSNRQYLPDSFNIPDYLFSINNKIEGFLLPEFNGINLSTILKSKEITKKEQIYYLKIIGDILLQLHHIREFTPLKDIYLNDLHASNFMVNLDKKQIGVIDLDSCKIGNNIAFASQYLTSSSLLNNVENKYQIVKGQTMPGHVVADENSDLYCYNIMILNYLYGQNVNNMGVTDFNDYLTYLEEIGFDKKLMGSFDKLISNCPNENPVNYLDSISETQVCRAKQLVYNQYRKKKMYFV